MCGEVEARVLVRDLLVEKTKSSRDMEGGLDGPPSSREPCEWSRYSTGRARAKSGSAGFGEWLSEDKGVRGVATVWRQEMRKRKSERSITELASSQGISGESSLVPSSKL